MTLDNRPRLSHGGRSELPFETGQEGGSNVESASSEL